MQTTFAATANDRSHRQIVVERDANVTPERAFEMWTDADELQGWLGINARIQLELGGRYELYFMPDAPLGEQGSEDCKVLSFEPGRMLSFSWNAPPHLNRTRDRHTHVVVYFDAHGDAQTRLRLVHGGFPVSGLLDDLQWEETIAYFTAAWPKLVDAFVGACL
ncbi:SRPBCC family protein [Microbacterium sp.]